MSVNTPPTENIPIFDPSVFPSASGTALTIATGLKYFLSYPIAQGAQIISDLTTTDLTTTNINGVSSAINITDHIQLSDNKDLRLGDGSIIKCSTSLSSPTQTDLGYYKYSATTDKGIVSSGYSSLITITNLPIGSYILSLTTSVSAFSSGSAKASFLQSPTNISSYITTYEVGAAGVGATIYVNFTGRIISSSSSSSYTWSAIVSAGTAICDTPAYSLFRIS
jgi:hypothetical protein